MFHHRRTLPSSSSDMKNFGHLFSGLKPAIKKHKLNARTTLLQCSNCMTAVTSQTFLLHITRLYRLEVWRWFDHFGWFGGLLLLWLLLFLLLWWFFFCHRYSTLSCCSLAFSSSRLVLCGRLLLLSWFVFSRCCWLLLGLTLLWFIFSYCRLLLCKEAN